NQLEIQKPRSGFRVHCGPARLVDNGQVRHLERRGFAICAECQSIRWYGRDPIQAFWRDRRMEVVNLVRGTAGPLKSQSCVSEDCPVCLARSPILTRHVAVVGGGSTPGESIAFIIPTHSVEAIAARKLAFKVIDAREFDIRH